MIQQFYSKENENINSKRHRHPYVHCIIIYASQDVETPKFHQQRNE